MSPHVTVTESLFIACAPEAVWNFAQGELHRPLWNDFCDEPKILEAKPHRLIRFHGCGLLSGTWTYEVRAGGTLWTQTNVLSLEGPFHKLLGPYLRWKLRRKTRRSMQKVREMLELSKDLSGTLHEDFF